MRSFLFALALLLSVYAQGQSVFWSIHREDGSKAGFLFGTVHSADNRVFDIYPGLQDSLLTCNGFAMEANVNEMNPAMISEGLQMRGDTSLRQLLGEAEILLVKSYFRDSLGIPPMLIQNMKPMFSASLVELNSMNADRALPLDLALQETADQNGLDLSYLETASEQLALFDSIPYSTQAHELAESVKSAMEGKEQSDTLITLYRKGNIDEIYNLTADEAVGDRFVEVFVDNRNRKMSGKIDELITEKSYFLAVGAAHLGGPAGLVKLLGKKGYRLTPIKGK